MLDKNEYKFIKIRRGLEKVPEKERIKDYSSIKVRRAKMKGWAQFAFILLRIYIIIMLAIVILGFLHLA
jgi:hypothetical protein